MKDCTHKRATKHVWRKLNCLKPNGERGVRVRTWRCAHCGEIKEVTKPCPAYLGGAK